MSTHCGFEAGATAVHRMAIDLSLLVHYKGQGPNTHEDKVQLDRAQLALNGSKQTDQTTC